MNIDDAYDKDLVFFCFLLSASCGRTKDKTCLEDEEEERDTCFSFVIITPDSQGDPSCCMHVC